MESVDVVIVGSGPAGASTALHLAARAPAIAAKTVLLEREHHPREKICAGGLSQRALRTLDALKIEVDVPRVRVDGAIIEYGGYSLDVGAGGTFGLVVRRNEFDALCARTALRRGVALFEGEALRDLQRDGTQWIVVTSKRSLRAKVVVGADGAGSLVRRRAGFPKGRRSTRLCVVETPVDESRTREFDARRISFDFDVLRDGVQGYYWDFPCIIEGRPHLSRGLFDRNPDPETRADLPAVLDRCLRARGERASTHTRKSFPEREFQVAMPISAHGLLLVGEAAGIDPLVGEGIAQALEYGALASEELARAFERNDFSFLGWKRRVLRSPLGRTLLSYRWLADRMYGARGPFWLEFLGSRHRAQRALVESFLGRRGAARTFGVVLAELLDFAATRASPAREAPYAGEA
jgi:flavin-dependent dehydrogenase